MTDACETVVSQSISAFAWLHSVNMGVAMFQPSSTELCISAFPSLSTFRRLPQETSLIHTQKELVHVGTMYDYNKSMPVHDHPSAVWTQAQATSEGTRCSVARCMSQPLRA